MNKLILSLAVIVLVGMGAIYVAHSKKETIKENPDQVVCTMEAKMCPDGSYVGRSGPACEFTPCPDAQTKEETTTGINGKILNGGVYITPLEVVSDSRCPAEVRCIWAGEVSIKVMLQKGTVNKEVTLKEGASATFEGSKVSLVGVTPANSTTKPPTESDYRFTFKVSSISPAGQGTVSGTVTTGPTCPVERMPPDPQCAPRPYATSIAIRKTGGAEVVKTITSDTSGRFSVQLNVGSYELDPVSGSVFPRCASVTVQVKSSQTTVADISCDTGIR